MLNKTRSSNDTPRTNPKDKKKRFVKHKKGHLVAINKSTDKSIDYTTTNSKSISNKLVEYINLTRNKIYTIPYSY